MSKEKNFGEPYEVTKKECKPSSTTENRKDLRQIEIMFYEKGPLLNPEVKDPPGNAPPHAHLGAAWPLRNRYKLPGK